MILRAKCLIDSGGYSLEDAEVEVHEKRIGAVRKIGAGSAAAESEIIDLGRAVLLPGLVNAHAHLELTLAHSQVEPKPRFTDWIREVVRVTGGWTEETFASSIRDGIRRSVGSGTTSLGDIGRGARDVRPYLESGMRVRLFHEVIGFDPSLAEATLESLKSRIGGMPSGGKLLIGISPHTPYTVSERLLRRCVELAHESGWALCIHLAETEAELQFLSAGTGEILEFRKEFGLPPGWKPPRAPPVRYLHQLGFFERPATLIHCNYVSEEDFDTIALSGSSVVFCPRSHRYFGHGEHPFLKMLARGINVALGTDSLISAPTLSILDEMKFVREQFPEVEPAAILRMGTVNGLKALGLPADGGRLAPGAPADLVGVTLPKEETEPFGDPLDAVFSANSKVIFSLADGEILLNACRTPEKRQTPSRTDPPGS